MLKSERNDFEYCINVVMVFIWSITYDCGIVELFVLWVWNEQMVVYFNYLWL